MTDAARLLALEPSNRPARDLQQKATARLRELQQEKTKRQHAHEIPNVLELCQRVILDRGPLVA